MSILFIGTGRKSMCNTFIPILRKLGARNITVITSSKRHENTLSNFNIDMLINSENYDYTKITGKFDIIIDSLSIYHDELKEHIKMAGNLSKYWIMNTPNNEIITKTNNMFMQRKLIGDWIYEIQMIVNSINSTCQIIPGELYQYNPLFLTEFSTFIDKENLNFPIIIDKMFNINDIQNAFKYINNNNEHILGSNIGINMNCNDKLNDVKMNCYNDNHINNNEQSNTNVNLYYLDDVSKYMDEYNKRQEKLIQQGFKTSKSLKMYNL